MSVNSITRRIEIIGVIPRWERQSFLEEYLDKKPKKLEWVTGYQCFCGWVGTYRELIDHLEGIHGWAHAMFSSQVRQARPAVLKGSNLKDKK